jgi:hypothetical protein
MIECRHINSMYIISECVWRGGGDCLTMRTFVSSDEREDL